MLLPSLSLRLIPSSPSLRCLGLQSFGRARVITPLFDPGIIGTWRLYKRLA